MDIDRLLSAVGIDTLPECWRNCWEEARRTFAGDAFIDPGMADLAAASTDLDDGFVEALRSTIAAIRANDMLLQFAWLWHYCFFDKAGPEPNAWPAPQAFGEDMAGMFSVAVLVTGLPRMLEMHKTLGIPEQITRDTLLDIAIWSEHYRSVHGRWGFAEPGWLQYHFLGKLFRLKRLEFMPMTYAGGYRVYRNKLDSRIIALAESGKRFRRDGLVDGTTGVTDPEAWESVLEEGDGFVRGCVVPAEGHATRETVEIRLDEWEVLLQKGTQLLDVHIPAGSGMDRQSCVDSYLMANDFYRRFFPDYRYTGFVCGSWLLDPELAKILPAESNIIQFQREYYLLPLLSDDGQTFERVFGSKPEDLTKAPRDTSLRRAILDHVLAGNNMSRSFGFIPADEVGEEHRYYGATG